MKFRHCGLSLAALLLLSSCRINVPSRKSSSQSSIQAKIDSDSSQAFAPDSDAQPSTQSDVDASSSLSSDSSLKEADKEAVRNVGAYLLKNSISDSSSIIKQVMNPVDTSSSSYKSNLAFPGIITYWCSLLMGHQSFDCSSQIIKFEHKVLWDGQSESFLFGCQMNVEVDRENNEIIVRGCQGEGADNYYAAMMMKVAYDFESKAIGDFFVFTGSFGDSYEIIRGTCFAREGDVFKTSDYPDEEASPVADPMINVFVSMIPSAVLVDGDEARAYIEEYIQAGEYYKSIGGNDAGLSIID
jgi:hypothetical protein